MTTSPSVPRDPVGHVNRPFVQRLHAVHAPCPLPPFRLSLSSRLGDQIDCRCVAVLAFKSPLFYLKWPEAPGQWLWPSGCAREKAGAPPPSGGRELSLRGDRKS